MNNKCPPGTGVSDKEKQGSNSVRQGIRGVNRMGVQGCKKVSG